MCRERGESAKSQWIPLAHLRGGSRKLRKWRRNCMLLSDILLYLRYSKELDICRCTNRIRRTFNGRVSRGRRLKHGPQERKFRKKKKNSYAGSTPLKSAFAPPPNQFRRQVQRFEPRQGLVSALMDLSLDSTCLYARVIPLFRLYCEYLSFIFY